MATLFCFTSTGNSLYAAERIADKIGGKVAPMSRDAVTCADDVIGLVFPVYFWGLPRMVERFIADMRIANAGAYVFAVATYGGIVHGATGRVKKLLKPKGVAFRYGVNLKMAENYIPRYRINDSKAFQQKIDENIIKIADAVTRRQSNRIQPFTILNQLIHKFYPDQSSDRHFSVASTCTGCATCQKVCPAKNITIKSGRPDFLHHCEHCLACLHHCPAQAIDWKQKTQGKARYRNSGVALNDLISLYK